MWRDYEDIKQDCAETVVLIEWIIGTFKTPAKLIICRLDTLLDGKRIWALKNPNPI